MRISSNAVMCGAVFALSACGPGFDEQTWAEKSESDFARAGVEATSACEAEKAAYKSEAEAEDQMRVERNRGSPGIVTYPSDYLKDCHELKGELNKGGASHLLG